MAIQEKTIGQCFAEAVQRYADRPAAADPENSCTYRELAERVYALSGSFLAHGYGKGTHIGVYAANNTDTLTAYYAVWCTGAVLVPVNMHFTERELSVCIQKADIELLLSDRETGVSGIPVWDLHDAVHCSKRVHGMPETAVCPEDTDTILFTSGTLAEPKPVLSVHSARVTTAVVQAETLRLTEDDVILSALPMFHCFGMTATVLPAMLAGACLCFPEDTHSRSILSAIERWRCTVFTGVPALYNAVMRRLESESYDIRSLRAGYIGGSTYTEAFFRKAEECLGMILLPSLGQTEATAGITSADPDDPFEVRCHTIGHLFPDLEYRIDEGELCIRGYAVMKGYYRMPEATAEAVSCDGWLHTGDLVREENGHFVSLGRRKELIIRNGENISPTEIETALLGDDRIRQCRVFGLPDPHYGEIVCAAVIRDEDMGEDDIREVLRGKLADYKIPQIIFFPDRLPMTSTGKADIRRLRSAAQNLLNKKEG